MLCLVSSTAAELYVAEPFEDTVVLFGLDNPTAVRIAPDGRVFVAEKRGVIKLYESLENPSAEVFADLTENVYAGEQRGLLGLALHPEFATHPFVYVLYAYDAPPGETAPFWNDICPTPPGSHEDGCLVTGRLSRFAAVPGVGAVEEVLVENNWCQQFPSHSLGALAFGPDGALYASAGDGADFSQADYGQLGGTLPGTPTPENPCGDPPVPPGGDQQPPDAEGGALRSQDLRTPSDPVSFDGALLRLDPETGAALPDNPLYGGAAEGDDRIIAYGLRNPFRFAIHPESGELFIGDVGRRHWEEINRIPDPTDEVVENFGWPCYEGVDPQPIYEAVGLSLCTELYEKPGSETPPFFAYAHGMPPDPDRCGGGDTSSITGLAFYPGGDFPRAYDEALFFTDFNRRCIWTFFAGPDGTPDPATVTTLVADAERPVDLTIGPGGLYYVDFAGGTVHRLAVGGHYVFADGFETGDLSAWSGAIP